MTSPTASGQDKAPTVAPVTVVGQAPAVQHLIDRKSYSLTGDAFADGEAIGDALRKIPSVNVDARGQISIRGDGDITILVDGQPSALFNGPVQAQSLRSLPANKFSRVEVITNPSAAYSPEGTGGIINLVTKKVVKKDAPSGELNATIDTLSDSTLTVSGSLPLSDKLTLNGDAGIHVDRATSSEQTTEVIDGGAGSSPLSVGQSSRTVRTDWGGYLEGGFDYRPTQNDHLSSSMFYFESHYRSLIDGDYVGRPSGNPLANAYADHQTNRTDWPGLFGSTNYTRDMGNDRQLLIGLTYSGDALSVKNGQTFVYSSPAASTLVQDQTSSRREYAGSLQVEYKFTAGGAKLDTGYTLSQSSNRNSNYGAEGATPASLVVAPALVDSFSFNQYVNALFITYERGFGRFDFMPGLRYETTNLNLKEANDPSRTSIAYGRLYPTFHFKYDIDKDSALTASYSLRIDRPSGQQLDPFRLEQTPLSFSAGNANLRPSTTDSYDIDYDNSKDNSSIDLDGYLKRTTNLIFEDRTNIGAAILSTYENAGSKTDAGLEASVTRNWSSKISSSLTVSGSWEKYDGAFATSQPGLVETAKATLNWTVTPSDFVQVTGYASSKYMNAEGYDMASAYVNLGYRHKFASGIAFEIRVLDPTNSSNYGYVVNSPNLKLKTIDTYHDRAVAVGLIYPLGGNAKPVDKSFSFGRSGGSP